MKKEDLTLYIQLMSKNDFIKGCIFNEFCDTHKKALEILADAKIQVIL